MSNSRLRPFSQKYWQERQILYAAEQQRKRRLWYLIGAMFAMLVFGAMVTLSIGAFPDEEQESTIMTGE